MNLKAQDSRPLYEGYDNTRISFAQAYPRIFKSWTIEKRKAHDDGFAFLSNRLAKLDPQLYKPLVNITYGLDIKGINVGSELVDGIEYYSADYSGIADTVNNLFGERGNIIPRIRGGLNQSRLPVFNFEIAYDITFVETEKLAKKQLPISIDKLYQETVLAAFDLFANRVAYLGVGENGGLLNNANVAVNVIPGVNATTFKTTATDQEILAVFNGIFKKYFNDSNYNINLIPDTILVPSFVAETLANRISTMYTNSLYDYLLEHNLAKNTAMVNGLASEFKMRIVARSQLDTEGMDGVGRIVVYKNDPMYVSLDIPYGLKSYYTGPNVQAMAYTTLWLAQVSQIKLPYNESDEVPGAVSYWDFEAA